MQPAGRSVPAEPEASAPPRRPVKRWPIIATLLVAAIIGLIVFLSRGFVSREKNSSVPAPAPVTSTEQPTPQVPAAAPPTQAETAPAPSPQSSVGQPDSSLKKAADSPGGIVHQVLPEASQSARNTINGTIRVSVRVEVDRSGKVTAAKLTNPGPSKYFAGLALKAAQRWEFAAPVSGGSPTASTWLLQFRIKRSSTQVLPERLTR